MYNNLLLEIVFKIAYMYNIMYKIIHMCQMKEPSPFSMILHEMSSTFMD